MPTANQILGVWEQGRAQTPVQRALSLLALAEPALSTHELAACRIGRRDRELLALRERIFGPRLTAAAQCPDCGQVVEADFSVADIQAGSPPELIAPVPFRTGDFELHFRLPTCGDLLELDHHANAGQQKKSLLQRCVTQIRCKGDDIDLEHLPEVIIIRLSAHMAEIDPQGDVQLALSCPKCNRQWQATLDVASYLWSEINAWALRTLREIHSLACAYGWSEPQILQLTPWRRQAYLELIQS